MQKITLIGNLTNDPQLRATLSGVSVCVFTVAVNRRFLVNGEKVTDYFNVNVWRQMGESCAKHLKKGKKVAVAGELQPRTYQAKDGTNRMSLDVSADEVEFLSSADKTATQTAPEADGLTTITSDDVPI